MVLLPVNGKSAKYILYFADTVSVSSQTFITFFSDIKMEDAGIPHRYKNRRERAHK